jgi:hypothetical protein
MCHMWHVAGGREGGGPRRQLEAAQPLVLCAVVVVHISRPNSITNSLRLPLFSSFPSPSRRALPQHTLLIQFLGLMAVERVASASVPDVTQTDSTATMPVTLARRAEDDTRTWLGARKPRPMRRPAARTPRTLRTILCSLSASGGQTAAQNPARALSHTPGLAASQPRGPAAKASQQSTLENQTPNRDGSHAA